jgi:hypothetical protein
MFIWKMRYPSGNVIPPNKYFQIKKIEKNNIGSPCILFHSKYKNISRWDNFKGSDFRFFIKLFEEIPNIKWINKTFIQINNYGDYGNRNDINTSLGYIYNKSFIWYLIPKYHFKIFNINIFHLKTYKNIFSNLKNKINSFFNL